MSDKPGVIYTIFNATMTKNINLMNEIKQIFHTVNNFNYFINCKVPKFLNLQRFRDNLQAQKYY